MLISANKPVFSLPRDWLYVRYPGRSAATALQWGEVQLDFARLRSAAEGWGGALLDAGLQPGQVLGVVSIDPWLIARALYGTLCIGAHLLPLDPGMAQQRYGALLQQAGCRLVLSGRAELSLPTGCRHIPAALLVREAGAPLLPPAREVGDRGGLIIATSGTSGEPKGVMLTSDNIAASVRASRQRIPIAPGACWLNCLPLVHIGGLSIFYRCLEAGASLLLHPGFDAEQVWQAIREQRVTHLSLVPPMLSRLLEIAEPPVPERLQIVLIGGGPLDPGLARRARAAGWPLCVSYGMSETGSQLATDCSGTSGLMPGCVGRPLDGFEIRLSTAGPEREAGCIQVRGPAVMAGYVNPELRPGSGLTQGWFETGDLGWLDSDGILTLMGRADELLVSAGKNIHPAEVEALVAACPEIGEVAVSGQRDRLWGDRLVLFYTGSVEQSAVELWLREHLPGALRPRTLIQLAALPRTALGKLERAALRRLLS